MAPQLTLEGSGLALWAEGRHVARVCAAVECADEPPTAVSDWRDEGDGWAGVAGAIRCTLEVHPGQGGAVVHCALRYDGARPPMLRRFQVALLPRSDIWDRAQGTPRGLKIAYCGAHSRSPSSRSLTMELVPGRRERGWWVGAIAPRKGGPGFVLGGADFRRFATAVDLEPAGLSAVQFLEGWRLEHGERLELAPLWLGVSGDAPLGLLEEYGAAVGRRHGAAPRAAPCGWGSWGHFLESIDADLMLENLLALESSRALRDAAQVVQIDDGWSELLESERASASWRPNRRFPSGIAPLADAVRRRGRECGLWILPFTVNEGSPLARTHPEYLVQDEHHQPKRVGGGASFCLDPFHPGARDWTVDLLARVRDWGVRYVKLDHLRALLMPDPDAADDDLDAVRVHHAPATRVEAYRRGLELVRQALGPDAFLVGCSAPAGPSIGLVDAYRVGPDIEPAWVGTSSGIRDATRALAANFFWQGRTWVNDPDYLLAGATMAESRFWATAIALSGGSAIVSADLSELPSWQEELFAMVTPPTGRAARPLDLFEHAPEPRLWHQVLNGAGAPWHLVGLFNWSEQPAEFSVEWASLGLEGPVHLWDAWRKRHRIARDRDTRCVEAHSAALLALRQVASEPQVVGTDIHFAQGAFVLAEERWDQAGLTLTLGASPTLPRSGWACVWAPPELRCIAGGVPLGDGSNTLRVPLERNSVVQLRFDESPQTGERG